MLQVRDKYGRVNDLVRYLMEPAKLESAGNSKETQKVAHVSSQKRKGMDSPSEDKALVSPSADTLKSAPVPKNEGRPSLREFLQNGMRKIRNCFAKK